MTQPESRVLHQCTYTPVVNDANVGDAMGQFRPGQFFHRQAILATVFDQKEKANLLLKEIRRKPQYAKQPAFKDIASAIAKVWQGDANKATQILNSMDVANIAAFARFALDIELGILKDATTLVADIISKLAQPPSHVASQTDANQPGTVQISVTASPQTVSRQDVQASLAKQAPRVANYLSMLGYFHFKHVVSPAGLSEMTSLQNSLALEFDLAEGKLQVVETLVETMNTEPIGYLHLERLQFTPEGYERGELVYSLPMLPGETVRLTHREWSRTETEYIKLVATSLETATEDALSEKSEMSQSFKNEEQHSSAFDASVSASGGYGPITISSSVGYNSQNSESRSRETSAQHSQEITRKAASRAREEHKISFRITTQLEIEEQSYREISNTLDRAVRWDFHRLMKKWKIDLYRYGVRLTYDIVIPEPASFLLRRYVRLQQINEQLATPNPFNLTPSNITRTNYSELARLYNAALEPPPSERIYASAHGEQTYSKNDTAGYGIVELSLADGYEFEQWEATSDVETADNPPIHLYGIETLKEENQQRLLAGSKYSNHYVWRYYYFFKTIHNGAWHEANEGEKFTIDIYTTGRLSERAFTAWKMQCFERLADAAAARYEQERQRLLKIRDDLLAELQGEDALTLRKLEKEELMKGVLRWVLGPGFSFYPGSLPSLSLNPAGDIEYYDPYSQGVKSSYHAPLLKHGEIIRFLHQAIEWENLNYVLYPYFWTDDYRWDFKQVLRHTDFQHRSFLRAGAARVVLTIRPGFEKAFLSYMETGLLDQLLPADHPYMSVADELKAMAHTSYPYTPGANEENPDNLVDSWHEFTPTGALDVKEGTVING